MIYKGDLFDVLPMFAADSIDAGVTDPPYGISMMAKGWDTFKQSQEFQAWTERWAREVYRVAKPGAYLLVCGAPRSFHRMTCGIEDAGFVVRDCLSWLYGQGFPKSLNLEGGLGTALKPAWEPIVLARKPLIDALDVNVGIFGTGALNVDACRIGTDGGTIYDGKHDEGNALNTFGNGLNNKTPVHVEGMGRWPPNVLLDSEAAQMLDEQTDALKASRFFYVAKPSGSERDEGCYDLTTKTGGEATDRKDGSDGLNSPRAGAGRGGRNRNFHPTVKPVSLMQWLVKLITPPDGTVLDPFMGSGTTGMAARLEDRKFIGVEREADYVEIAWRRISETNALFYGEEEIR